MEDFSYGVKRIDELEMIVSSRGKKREMVQLTNEVEEKLLYTIIL